ncbi:lasso peptide biosynthesis B2 protein [Salipiger abyssi]|uniref:lasso peptide biosynthesis B2 protein n=1 Tax=Salipiger abyssi TaxID=1250539 RepID=UPI001A8EA64A|nr:lasso peptide biosynthesis B2 protein [Salipiger abyssi]MBN9886282.1 lasso peptide biosynthesis B2 protein [Salipiger abyssi]
MDRLGRVLRSPHRLHLLVTALVAVARARLALILRQMPRLRAGIDAERAQAATATGTLSPLHDLREIAWSVTAAARLVPGATCLTQALAGDWLLAKRGRGGEIRLSLPVDTGEGFRPHAWLLSDGVIVLGGSSEDYARHRAFEPAANTPSRLQSARE